ncbi:hypothetical protein KRX19_07890 [Cardiobacteriaceae bacterium TAE3-ERU3]|nr:hypothetical protein [Cardiobacteriaceae bacterium TAE3-ERU3]
MASDSTLLPDFTNKAGWANGSWKVRTSLYTRHYNPKPEHNNHQKLLNVEYQRQDDWSVGIALYSNSFGQPSQYAYLGYEWTLWSNQDWQMHASLTGGLLHGYKGEYKNKIPLNKYGVAPVLLPTLGWSYKQHWFAEAQFFAAAGVMATVGYRF